MSAFIVNDKTINRIVSFLNSYSFQDSKLKECFSNLIDEELILEGTKDERLKSIGKKLLKLNYDAVKQRYNKLSKVEDDILKEYTFVYDKCDIFQAYKHLCCLTYQMSEGDIPKTNLFKLLEKIETDLAVSIAWEVTEEKKCEWEAK